MPALPFITDPAELHPGMRVLTVLRGIRNVRRGDWRLTLVTAENQPWLLRAYMVTAAMRPRPTDPAPRVPTWENLRERVEYFEREGY